MTLSRFAGLIVFMSVACAREAAPPPAVAPTAADVECCCEVDPKALLAANAFRSTLYRNPVNTTEKNIADDWSVEEGKHKNVKWVADVGNRGYGTPVIAEGKVYVATNNRAPRDPKVKGAKAVLMCFEAKTGKFLWQNVHEMAPAEVDQQAKEDGLCSPPAASAGKLYYVTPGSIVTCADAGDGKVQWSYDLMKELKVYPCIINACSPLVVGETVFVMTANGVNDEGKVQEPKAPSFVALNAKDGKLVWQSNLPGENIIHGQWGNPVYAEVAGQGQVIFPGGDGYLYSLEPKTGKLVWKFLIAPADAKDNDNTRRNYPLATPVVHQNRVYVGVGAAPDTGYGARAGHFWCIDVTKKGDVSAAPGNFDPKSPANKNSALVWHYGGEIMPRPARGRTVAFGKTMSSAAVHDGLVYISEEDGYVHCLDAATGQKHWMHDMKTAIWGSPYWVDGKVYLGGEDGELQIFAHGKDLKVIRAVDMGDTIQSTPVAANGVLYVLTKNKLYAIGAK